jgi:Uma2 family endonuclease
MTTARKLMTADELLAMPRGDGRKFELVRGVLVEKAGTGNAKGSVVATVATVLGMFVYARDCGELAAGDPGYLLEVAPDTVRSTDVAWISSSRIPDGTTGYPNVAPDLVLEVKSHDQAYAEMFRRAQMWLSFDARQVWVADPDTTTVTVYRTGAVSVELGEDDDIDGGDLLPDFTAPVWSLFRWQR